MVLNTDPLIDPLKRLMPFLAWSLHKSMYSLLVLAILIVRPIE
jgi:hypothetical protein